MELLKIQKALHLPRITNRELDALDITHVCTDSSLVGPNTAFVAIGGHHHAPTDYIEDAISRGARVIVCEEDIRLPDIFYLIKTKNARKTGAEILNYILDDPLGKMKFVFVTGTKGKSTTCIFLEHLLNLSSPRCASIGTLGVHFLDYRADLPNTTPDLFVLLPHLKRICDMGARWCVLEVSSQALRDFRIDTLTGEYAIFTGISLDHIDPDEHTDFSDYREAKRRLFTSFGVKYAFSPRQCSLAPFMTLGVEHSFFVDTRAPSDLTLKVLEMSKSCIRFTDGEHEGVLGMSGEFNLQNAALAFLCASKILGVPPHTLYGALSDVHIDGRMEWHRGCSGDVLIDYAHNAESVRSVASLVRSVKSGRLIGVIGTVGGRARGRRAELARACEDAFDITVLTEDDTAEEELDMLLLELSSYFRDKSRFRIERDRSRAISLALSLAGPSDTVLLLGKGHERFLVRSGRRIPFDERGTLYEIVGKHGKM